MTSTTEELSPGAIRYQGYARRRRAIWTKKQAGASVSSLAEEYGLAEGTIRNILVIAGKEQKQTAG